MDIKKVNNLVLYLYGKAALPPEEERNCRAYLEKYAEEIYSRIFYEYTQLEISNHTARGFLDKVLKNRQEMEATLQRELDLRVAFLDCLMQNLHTIRQAAEPRIIEDKILRSLNSLIVQDELTGLYNFRHYKIELEKEFSRCLRNGNNFSLAILDIDDFKLYNDSYGHQAGNRVLQKIGGVILKSIRKIDIPCRYGGEEFALILPQTDGHGAFILIDRIRRQVAGLRFKQTITLSGGIATFPADTVKTDRSLFTYADRALYHSKAGGKNMITLYADLVATGRDMPEAEARDLHPTAGLWQ